MMNNTRAWWRSVRQFLQCFNIAAICALAVWHAYAFYLQGAMTRAAKPAVIELLPLPLPSHQQNTPRIIT